MKIKVVEEDFKVEEIPKNFELRTEYLDGYDYVHYLLEKKNWNTLDVVETVARRLRINAKSIGYAGNKDKKAVTSQRISIPLSAINNVKDVENLNIKNCNAKFLGYCNERITLGDLEGNKFTIVVRRLDEERDIQISRIKNYFGQQRFGVDNKNVLVGKALLKKDFKKVCSLLGLDVSDNNFVGVLKELDARVLRLYLGAYQSFLWNNAAKKVKEVDELELVGFLTEFQESTKKIYEELMNKEGVKLEDFLIKQFKEISMEGGMRKLHVDVENFSCSWKDDELFSGFKKCTMFFSLKKGCYATEVVKAIFG